MNKRRINLTHILSQSAAPPYSSVAGTKALIKDIMKIQWSLLMHLFRASAWWGPMLPAPFKNSLQAPGFRLPKLFFALFLAKISMLPEFYRFFCFRAPCSLAFLAPCSLAYLAPFSKLPKTPCGGSFQLRLSKGLFLSQNVLKDTSYAWTKMSALSDACNARVTWEWSSESP